MPRKFVLCVDDEETVRLTTMLILERAGYDVLSAANTGDAIKLLNGVAFDVVLLDCVPEKERLIAKIRALRAGTRIILFTGDLVHPDSAGVDGVIFKPCAFEDLLHAVEAMSTPKAA